METINLKTELNVEQIYKSKEISIEMMEVDSIRLLKYLLKKENTNLILKDDKNFYNLDNVDFEINIYGLSKITFTNIYVNQSNIFPDSTPSYSIYKFHISKNRELFNIMIADKKTYELVIDKSKIEFSCDNNFIYLKIFDNKVKNLNNRLSIKKIIQYHFFISGHILEIALPVKVYYDNDLSIDSYISMIYENQQVFRFSRFKLSLTIEQYFSGYVMFEKILEKSLYPIGVYLSTQLKNGFFIDQRVAIILNSLEGLVKSQKIDQKDKKVNKVTKKEIILDLQSKLLEYVDSNDFKAKFNSKIEEQLQDIILNKIKNSIGQISEYSFDEMLENSKKISKTGFEFVSKTKIVFNFWYKCKQHRNHFAHLTEKTNKGFDNLQCVFAMYILSTYFRLIIIELLNLNSSINAISLESEINSILEWKSKNNIPEI